MRYKYRCDATIANPPACTCIEKIKAIDNLLKIEKKTSDIDIDKEALNKVMQEEFNIPDNIKPMALIVMGYPDESATPHEFHNTFRPMEDVVVYDSF